MWSTGGTITVIEGDQVLPTSIPTARRAHEAILFLVRLQRDAGRMAPDPRVGARASLV